MKLVHWSLMGELLHLVQRGGDWAGPDKNMFFTFLLSHRCFYNCDNICTKNQCTSATTVPCCWDLCARG